MATYIGTKGNDFINGPVVAKDSNIDGDEGDDTVILGSRQIFVSGPGNDIIKGTGQSDYALWPAKEPATVDLFLGYALDGYGFKDSIEGINTVHGTQFGVTVIGTDANETVFIFGGKNNIDLGGGYDTVYYWEQKSIDYSIVFNLDHFEVKKAGVATIDILRGVEFIEFKGIAYFDKRIILNDYISSAPVSSATYSLIASNATINEGSTATFTLTTTNVSSGTSVPYILSGTGINTADILGGSLSGTSVVNSSGVATISVALLNDLLTEGTETLTVSAGGTSASTLIYDSSKTPSYNIYADYTSYNEGSRVGFYLETTNVDAGTSLTYTLSGVNSADIMGGSLTGTTIVGTNGNQKSVIYFSTVNDNLTEGNEILTLTINGVSASTTINDTSKSQGDPSYGLIFSKPPVNEGSTASFTLYTSYVAKGSSVPYTLSGISAADISGGSLSGTVTIEPNGQATISIPLANDNLTEGMETLIVTVGGVSASTLINDTSINATTTSTLVEGVGAVKLYKNSDGTSWAFESNVYTSIKDYGQPPTPTNISDIVAADYYNGYRVVVFYGGHTWYVNNNWQKAAVGPNGADTTTLYVDETGAITASKPVVVTPITSVASIPYGDGKYFYGSSGSDKVTGTFFVDVVKQTSTVSSNQLTKLSDGSWQVQNKFTPSNSDNLVNVERIEFSDMSVALDVSGPAGQVAKILGSVFGKSYVSNTVFAGIGLAYLDGGMSYLDLCGLAAGAAGLSSSDLLVTTLLRNTTGSEPTALSKSSYLQSISNGASHASVVQQLADSSANTQSINLTDLANIGLAYTPHVLPPTYSLSASTASVNEGSTAVFNLTTTNIAVGTEVSYTLSGVSPSDLTSGTLNGKVSIRGGGVTSISVQIAADGTTEVQEALTISAQGATASIVINDTSKGSAAPTYTLTPATLSVNEGELARIYVNTTNVAAGTVLQYGVSGVSSSDVIGGLTRLVTIDSLGQAVINIQTVADQLTEGPEAIYITLGSATNSLIINDTSVTLVGISDGGGDGGGGGGGDGGGGGGGG